MIKIDPVCGMTQEWDVATRMNVPSSVYEGKTYYFCSADCRDEFNADPEEYVVSDDDDDSDLVAP